MSTILTERSVMSCANDDDDDDDRDDDDDNYEINVVCLVDISISL